MLRALLIFVVLLNIPNVFSQDFISVNLSSYKSITEDSPMWLGPEEVSIPTFFVELEFMCNSSFPTKWILSKNPMEEKGLMEIPKISKTRSINSDKATFSSQINFRFKDPRHIPAFACQSIENERPFSISIESTYTSPTKLTTKFIRNKVIPATEKIYGDSQDCRLTLEVDFQRKAFACEKNGIRNLRPWVVSCRNPDECDSIAFSGKSLCGNSIKYQCNEGCNEFKPQKEPGLILCGDGSNSLAVKYTVLSNESSNISHLVTFDETTQPKALIHLLNSNYIVYDKQPFELVCKASKYVFSRGFQWMLTTATGSSSFLDGSNETITVKEGSYFITKKILFDISKNGNVTKISCIGPLWNSRASAIADCAVTLKASTRPTIIEPNKIIQQVSGDVNLDCTYLAEPKPQVTWLYWGRPVETKDLKFLKISHQNGFSRITVSNLENQAKSDRRRMNISCRVENFLGAEERVFIIRVQENAQNDGRVNRILLICAVCLLLLTIVFLGGVWSYLIWLRKKNLEYIKKDIQLFLEGDPAAVAQDDKDVTSLAHKKPYNTDLEISLENIHIDKQNALGAGAYGMVFRGTLSGRNDILTTNVAVKTVRPNVEPSYFKTLLTELKIMIYVGQHENIVNFIGACTSKIYQMELYIVMELCSNGELEKFLKDHKTEYLGSVHSILPQTSAISNLDLLKWSYQIANGMEYLASKRVIHGDIAARNVLLNDSLVAKLCDFGLSRQLYQYSKYVKKQEQVLPWRWMAIESLKNFEFSSESDVWSYGITLWEIFTLGELPYPGQLSWTNEFMLSIMDGLRMEKPIDCSDKIFKIMLRCWNVNPKERPTFSELKHEFYQMIV